MKYAAYIFAAAVIIVAAIPFMILNMFPAPEEEILPEPENLNLQELSEMNISVLLEDENQTVELPLEEYVAGVVASEMPASFELEALKAQAVAARTYGLARQGGLCDTVHCQVYRSEEEIRSIKGDEWMNEYWDKIRAAVAGTAGQVMYYDGALAGQVMFHSSSGGKTENSEEVFVSAVPYLRSVDSPYEEEATHKNDENVFRIQDFINVINGQYAVKPITEEDLNSMEVTAKSSGGRVAVIRIGENEFTGKQMRSMFKLPSANFTYRIEGENIIITTTGYGHGVGMSQYGANGMAREGYKYDEILTHYYSGVSIEKYSQQ
ncbi:MAG: stage II sporulation protein D [Bacillota bacterium]|nr:stage II sporulation protein D [Bacillota bacterium]